MLLMLLACGSEPAPPAASVAAPIQAPAAVAYTGRFATDPRLTPEDVARMDPDQLVYIRNEVFARHGRAFKTDHIREHFEGQAWYRVNPDYNDALLTDNDKANADLIKSFEGAGSQSPVDIGEYSGDPPMMFVDDTLVTLMWGEGMYEHLNVTHNWSPRGDYVVTWTGSATFDPSSKECTEATLWKLDHDQQVVTHVAKLSTG